MKAHLLLRGAASAVAGLFLLLGYRVDCQLRLLRS